MMPSWGSQMPPMQGAMMPQPGTVSSQVMPRSPQINLSALGGSQMRRSPYGY
jgi:hypothetical protein